MITLDYYDDNKVRDNAVFFTMKKIYAIVIACFLSFGFSVYKLYELIKIEENTQIAQIAQIVFFCNHFGNEFHYNYHVYDALFLQRR